MAYTIESFMAWTSSPLNSNFVPITALILFWASLSSLNHGVIGEGIFSNPVWFGVVFITGPNRFVTFSYLVLVCVCVWMYIIPVCIGAHWLIDELCLLVCVCVCVCVCGCGCIYLSVMMYVWEGRCPHFILSCSVWVPVTVSGLLNYHPFVQSNQSPHRIMYVIKNWAIRSDSYW